MYNNENKPYRRKGHFFFLFILVAIFGLPVLIMFLWNEILPPLIHVSTISYWHSLGLLILCRILFGGFKFGGGPSRSHWKEKWGSMSEEEKEALKQKMKSRWGRNC
ncbi:MAG: hypothetical protein H0W61_10900 [Bacteroidetes bacterium]|nr:hypothetical protein [Bacteroidota bacterium]